MTLSDQQLGQLADLLADRLLARLEPVLVSKVKALTKPPKESRLLTFRAAARRLGVSRNDTLHDLIAQRKLRTVTVAGNVRIPLSEVERVEQEGATRIVGKTKVAKPPDPWGPAPLAADELRKLRAAEEERRRVDVGRRRS